VVGQVQISAQSGAFTAQRTVSISNNARAVMAGMPIAVAAFATQGAFASTVTSRLVRFDPGSGTVLDSVAVFGPTQDVAFNHAGTAAYVGVYKIDLASGGVILPPLIDAGITVNSICLSPDDAVVFLNGTNFLYPVDLAADTSLPAIPTGADNNHCTVSAARSRLYVNSPGNHEVVEVDVQSRQETRRFTGLGVAQGLQVSTDGSRLYIAEEIEERLTVWNLATGLRDTSIALPGRPFGLRLSADGSQLYVGTSNGLVEVFDRPTLSRVNTFVLGGNPRRLAVLGSQILVANLAGWVDMLP